MVVPFITQAVMAVATAVWKTVVWVAGTTVELAAVTAQDVEADAVVAVLVAAQVAPDVLPVVDVILAVVGDARQDVWHLLMQ